ncbi:MAG TPA: TIGR01777 family oxidoreductase [Vicinamibacterales bacterium]|jgi:hypothetical protein
MLVVIAGGTGFLGQPLATALAAEGHAVTVLTRKGSPPSATERPAPGSVGQVQWNPDGTTGPWTQALDGATAVINLAGESIAARRWTAAQKARLVDSRRAATRSLVAAIGSSRQPPPVFISASAIGYYGDRGAEALTETSGPGSDFLATLAVEWERLALQAQSPRTRVALVRTGIVLDPHGGALGRMLLPFKAFVGGPLGSGKQYMSWIHRGDWLALLRWMTTNDAASGPINATAPAPVTNAEFSRHLGRALGRPSLLPAPAFALRLLLGEMADPLLLTSQRVLPARAESLGFQFSYPTLGPALQALLS